MTSFLIDTPYHKRWWLPCGCHQYNSVLHGDRFYCSILNPLTGTPVTSWEIEIKEGWEDLNQLSQELADKHHPRPLGRRTSRCTIVPLATQADMRRAARTPHSEENSK